MKLYRFERAQTLPICQEAAWSFFSNPGNLGRITPPSMGFEVTSDLPDRMYAGMIVSYRVRPFPFVPVRWVTEITHVEEPVRFVDEQRFGPYRFWHHEHHFQAVDAGVEMRDIIHYGLWGWPFTPLADMVVRRQLTAIFAYRTRVVSELFRTPA